ncbi:MAG: hypothetical protein IJ071_10360 [Ruminococcus sp.]|nr:hypothetical protein [Ruminococcus sp.]
MDTSLLISRCKNAVLSVLLSAVLGIFLSMSVTGFFGSSASSAVRVIGSALTVGLLCVFLGNCGLKDAEADKKSGGGSMALAAVTAAASSLPTMLSWIVLVVTRPFAGGFYRIFKLINGWGFQICNLINRSASSKDLTSGQTALLGALVIVPALVYWCFYAGSRMGRED